MSPKLNKNGFKTRLWDDSGTILYVYNILGYRETLSEKTGKSQKMSKNIFFKNVLKKMKKFETF